jgi:hypothetical protein
VTTLAIACLVASNIATVVFAQWRHRAVRRQIATVLRDLTAERRLVTMLREYLDRLGYTTDIRPRADGFYDLSFDARAQRSRVDSLGRFYRGPVGRA